jgi:hypothetical protein
MPDESFGGPDEFDPQEPLLALIPPTAQCFGINFDGTRCLRRITHERSFCIAHEPTPETVLGTLYQRLQSFIQNCAQCGPASAAEIITLSHAAKAFAVLWDRKITMDQAKQEVEAVGWRMKGTG